MTVSDRSAASKVALITGVTGQDGALFGGVSAAKGLYGPRHQAPLFVIQHRPGRSPLCRSARGRRPLLHALWRHDRCHQPHSHRPGNAADEIYNLAAQSHVQVSFETPEYTANADALGPLRLLEAIRILGLEKQVAFLSGLDLRALRQASRRCRSAKRRRSIPRSPYAAAKLYAYWITVNYREAYGMHASNGILFNHESPMRGETFVTRKITRAVAAIELGLQDWLYLGNLDAERDWGHARDYVEGMWLILQQDEPDDYVLATGEKHSVREFVELAFAAGRPQHRLARRRHGGDRRRLRKSGAGSGRGRSALFPPDRGRPPARRSRQGAREARLAPQDELCRIWSRRWSTATCAVRLEKERGTA